MATVKFGDPKVVAPKAKKITPVRTPELDDPGLSQSELTLTFYATMGAYIEARQRLHRAVLNVWEIDIDALGDPKNADHPQLPQMLALYDRRLDEEREAWKVAIEYANGCQWMWMHMDRATKAASGLLQLFGIGPDEQDIASNVFLAMESPIAYLFPLPETVDVHEDLTYMVGRMPGVTVSWQSVIEAEHPPF